jgi:prepilin-type processing-associated H-X9-DG protein
MEAPFSNRILDEQRGPASPRPSIPSSAESPRPEQTPSKTAYFRGDEGVNDTSLFADHPAGANVAFCDGFTRLIGIDVDDAILIGLASRKGGEFVSPP